MPAYSYVYHSGIYGIQHFRSLVTVLLINLLLLLMGNLSAQTPDDDTLSVEFWRQKGYEARMNGDMEASLSFYQRVLTLDLNDWDANLAVARIYFSGEDYPRAAIHYLKVHQYDSTNTEALYGLGRCNYRQGKFTEAATWYKKALIFLPDHFPLLEDLSYALINDNKPKEAVVVYRKMTEANPSSALAWAGLGKVMLNTGKPASALNYFDKALKLDPENPEIKKLHLQAKNQMALTLGYQFMYINENEPIDKGSDTLAYNIDALVNVISFTKRVSDRLVLRFSHLLDNSERIYWNQPDTNRWYDNTSLRATMLLGKHTLSAYAGLSVFENQWTTYGFYWETSYRLKKVQISNTFTAGYDYYYYWNQVGHDFVSDAFRLTAGRFRLDATYRYVNVRELYLIELDTLGRNPGHQYSITARYSLFKNPKVTLGIYHQYRDYTYRSTRYWSPQDRKLNGGLLSVYWESKQGFYMTATGNIGQDSYDIGHWEAAVDMGYNRKTTGYSIGFSRFSNPWYDNMVAYISFTKRFVRK